MDVEKYKSLLKEYVSFQSISTDPDKKSGIIDTVSWLKSLFEMRGFKVTILQKMGINPVVFAEYKNKDAMESVLVYGHYDVQPASKEDGWDFEPFKLIEKNDRLYARGVVDNKGQNLIHIFTVIELIKQGKLKYTVKFLLEGDEETGGVEQMREIMIENKAILESDYVIVSDGEMVAGKPAIEGSYRGGFNLTVKYQTANNNVHSGLYGGAVPNALFELSKLLGKLYGEDNRVAVEGFYNGVDEINKTVLENNRKLSEMGQEQALAHPGFKQLHAEEGFDFYTQTGLRPTLQITGVKGGYVGNGYSNIIPAMVEARINFRLVASQSPNEVLKLFKKFVSENTPEYVSYTIEVSGMHDPVKLHTNSPIFKKVKDILRSSYDNEVFNYYVGGAIPFIANVKEIFGVDTISIGLANEDCNMHGANENFDIKLIEKGLKFSKKFFSLD